VEYKGTFPDLSLIECNVGYASGAKANTRSRSVLREAGYRIEYNFEQDIYTLHGDSNTYVFGDMSTYLPHAMVATVTQRGWYVLYVPHRGYVCTIRTLPWVDVSPIRGFRDLRYLLGYP